MASTNKTTTLELSQFVGTDVPGWLTDYNSDMSKIDAFASEANSNISEAEQKANSANTTAQAASTAANQAVTTAQGALTTANNAANVPNQWKTVNLENPNSGVFTYYNGFVKYNKALGIAYVNLTANFTAGAVTTGTVCARIGSDFAPGNSLTIPGLFIGATNTASTDGKNISYTGAFKNDGTITFESTATSDTAILRINGMFSLAGLGNGWAQSA